MTHPPHPGQGQQPEHIHQSHIDQSQPVAEAPTVAKRSKTPAIIATVIAFALIVGGAWLGLGLFRGSTPAAAQALPGDALGVIEINLNPPADQKLALRDWAKKFPSFEAHASTTDYKEALWQIIANDSSAPDYSELKPWLGDSIAFAAVKSKGVGTKQLLAIETTDKGKAEAFAQKHMKSSKISFVGSTMLIHDETLELDTAKIEGNSIAENPDYRADRDKLGGTHLATAWFTSEGIQELNPAFISQDQLSLPKTRMFLGLKAEGEAISLEGVSHQSEPVTKGEDVGKLLGGMPADSIGGAAFSISENSYTQVWDLLKPLQAVTPEANSWSDQSGISSAADLKALFGTSAGLSVAGSPDSDTGPRIVLKTKGADPKRQKDLVAGFVGGQTDNLSVKTEGEFTVLTVGLPPEAALNPTSRLKDDQVYAKAAGKLGGGETLVWVNLSKLRSLPWVKDKIGSSVLHESLEVFNGIAAKGETLDGDYSKMTLIALS